MLSDVQIERYGRQILLPEVGGRGQARLLAARVTVAGDGAAAAEAATLLGRAGVGTLDFLDGPAHLPELSPDCRIALHGGHDARDHPPHVLLDLRDHPAAPGAPPGCRAAPGDRPVVVGRQRGARAVVALLVGRPCLACLDPDALALAAAGDTPALFEPTALALGALAAGEVLCALLGVAATGRLHVLALDDGTLRTTPLGPGRTCSVCGAGA